MIFSFLKRFFREKPQSEAPPVSPPLFEDLAKEVGGHFFADYKLFLHETRTTIDLLLFHPQRGLYLGEKLSWRHDELKTATLQRASRTLKTPPTTRFDSTEAKIRQKLTDVLSFDSTPCVRFVWMEHLSEAEYDTLDPSFHELLPKSRLIFADEPLHSALEKLESLQEAAPEPYCPLKVVGSLNAHRLLLPTEQTPFGSFLSDEQHLFLDTGYDDAQTTLYGLSGSGKSTLLLRKAIELVLHDPKRKVLIITPTLLAGELLRNKLIDLMEYGAFALPLEAIVFYAPNTIEPLESSKILEEAYALFCDDAYRMDPAFLDMLRQRRAHRWLLFATTSEPDSLENTFFLLNRYRLAHSVLTHHTTKEKLLFTLLSLLRAALVDTAPNDILVILPEPAMIPAYKSAIDEYLSLNCRVITEGFSLQYQNLDDLLLSTAACINGMRIPRLFILVPETNDDYRFELSRASETATIISFSDPCETAVSQEPSEGNASEPILSSQES